MSYPQLLSRQPGEAWAHHNGVLFLCKNSGSLKCFEKGSGDLIMGKRIFGIMEKGIMMRKQEGTVKRRRPKIEEIKILYIEHEAGQ